MMKHRSLVACGIAMGTSACCAFRICAGMPLRLDAGLVISALFGVATVSVSVYVARLLWEN